MKLFIVLLAVVALANAEDFNRFKNFDFSQFGPQNWNFDLIQNAASKIPSAVQDQIKQYSQGFDLAAVQDKLKEMNQNFDMSKIQDTARTQLEEYGQKLDLQNFGDKLKGQDFDFDKIRNVAKEQIENTKAKLENSEIFQGFKDTFDVESFLKKIEDNGHFRSIFDVSNRSRRDVEVQEDEEVVEEETTEQVAETEEEKHAHKGWKQQKGGDRKGHEHKRPEFAQGSKDWKRPNQFRQAVQSQQESHFGKFGRGRNQVKADDSSEESSEESGEVVRGPFGKGPRRQFPSKEQIEALKQRFADPESLNERRGNRGRRDVEAEEIVEESPVVEETETVETKEEKPANKGWKQQKGGDHKGHEHKRPEFAQGSKDWKRPNQFREAVQENNFGKFGRDRKQLRKEVSSEESDESSKEIRGQKFTPHNFRQGQKPQISFEDFKQRFAGANSQPQKFNFSPEQFNQKQFSFEKFRQSQQLPQQRQFPNWF